MHAGLLTGLAAQAEHAAQDRLNAIGHAGIGEFESAEEIAGVGHRHRRHTLLPGERRQLAGMDGTLKQRIGRMDAQMNKAVAHG